MALTRQFMDETLTTRPDKDPASPDQVREKMEGEVAVQMAMLDDMFDDRGKAGNRDFIVGYVTGVLDALDGVIGIHARIEDRSADSGWTADRLLMFMSAGLWQYLKDLEMDGDVVFYGDVMIKKNLELTIGVLRDRLTQGLTASGDTDQK
jgi:hypothetical protein